MPFASRKPQRKVLLATDLTRQIVDSMPEDVGSIVVYHPAIFRGLKKMTQNDALQSCLLQYVASALIAEYNLI
jgi:putative NIF3 family GTP cyclohydrolase 1 type 2